MKMKIFGIQYLQKVRFFLPFLGRFGQKESKFGTHTYMNILKLMVMFNFSVLDWKYTIWPKNFI